MTNERRKEIYLRDRQQMTPAQARRWRKHDNRMAQESEDDD